MPKSTKSLDELLYDVRRIAEHREILTEKKIKSLYKSLEKDLDGFIGGEYKKYADADGRFYMAYLDAQNGRARFLQQIIESVDGISPQLKEEMTKLVNETYELTYQGMVDAVKKADTRQELERITKDIDVSPDVLKQAVNNNISKLTLPTVMEKHRAEIIYQIQQVLTIGLANGDRYETMAKRVSERVGVSQSKAMNIARTESHRNTESGFMDCAEHIQEGLDGSDLIYAATWRTMDDGRVRPYVRRKTKSGWKTYISKNGANHVKMEGVTVKAGELFNLGNGVKAKAPSQSGVAAHDCNCRCFLEYNLMTAEEFANATGRKTTKQLKAENNITDLDMREVQDKQEFANSIKEAKKANPHGGAVDEHSIEELQTFKTYLSSNGMAGVAVKPDGDITAVFKNSNYKARGAVNDLIITARENGGVKMDCYGIGLVNKYERCGYTVVARVEFNADYVSDPWLLETKPDVYVLMKNTDSIETVIKKNGANAYKLSSQEMLDNLPTFDYDDALAYRDELLRLQEGIK